MAEQIHYRPAEAKRLRQDTEAEFERLEGRLAEIHGLLDELYASGVIRWLKDLAGAMPQVSTIAVENVNTPQGRAGLRNLTIVAQQLGRIDPARLERTFDAVNAGMDQAREAANAPAKDKTPYNPPGVTGAFKLLHDKELWAALPPLIAGAKAFSAAHKEHADAHADAHGDAHGDANSDKG